VAKWFPGRLLSLGTDGFGRSESRQALRDFFEVDHRHVALAALYGLVEAGKLKPAILGKALKKLEIDTKRANPWLL
jgi:pyruvate dehydrogenase E1 component